MEPRLVAHNPSCLQAGEDAPLHAADLDAALGIATELAVGVHGQVTLDIVAVLPVVSGLSVPGQSGPLLVEALVDFVRGAVDIRGLVVTGVVTALVVAAVGLVHETEAAEQVDVVSVVGVLPLDAGVAGNGVVFAVERTDLVLHGVLQSCHIVAWHTVEGHVVLLVGVDQSVVEERADAQVLVWIPLGGNRENHVGVVEVVLVLGRSVLVDGERVGQLPVGVAQRADFGEVVLIDDVEVGVVDYTHAGGGIGHEGIRTEHRALGVGQEVGAGHSSVVVVGRSTGIE